MPPASISDQMTSREVRDLLSEYETRLKELEVREAPPAEVAGIQGGDLLESELGYGLVSPNLSLRQSSKLVGLKSKYPIVEVTWRLKRRQQVKEAYLYSSPSCLVEKGHTDFRPRKQHLISVSERTKTVKAQLMVFTQELAMRPLQLDPEPEDFQFPEYEVPPSATSIVGAGFLKYRNGPKVWVSPDGPQPLFRVTAEGDLERSEGGVYASFFGPEPAQVKVGHRWLQTAQIT